MISQFLVYSALIRILLHIFVEENYQTKIYRCLYPSARVHRPRFKSGLSSLFLSCSLLFCLSSLLHYLKRQKCPPCIRSTLKCDCYPLQSKEGKSPLHMAAIHGRFTRSQILIQNGNTECPVSYLFLFYYKIMSLSLSLLLMGL